MNPPVRWWRRIAEWDRARAARTAREWIDEHGYAAASQEQRRLYDWIVQVMRDG